MIWTERKKTEIFKVQKLKKDGKEEGMDQSNE
jgi:hypothetical protein